MTMDRQIRKLGIALAVCFSILFLQLTYIQVLGAGRINDNPDNTRQRNRALNQGRGTIFSVEGDVLAESVEQREGIAFRRVYPTGDLFGPVTGYYSPINIGSTGVEAEYDDVLSGEDPEISMGRLSDLFSNDVRLGNVHLTLSTEVQRIATEQLAGREGSVVVLDPRNGAIDAMVSVPTFDPNPLSTNDQEAVDIKTLLDADPENPLLFRAYREIFFPGSTFKVVTGAAAVDRGQVTEDFPVYPEESEFDIDFTDTDLRNFGGTTCGGTLFQLLEVSCNTGFAQMGVSDLGTTNLLAGAEAFGFNQDVPIDLPAPAVSVFPTNIPNAVDDNGPTARASIGQGDVSSTPLLMAMVAGAIANGGSMAAPHVLDRITDQDGEEVSTFDASEWRRAVSADAADVLRRGMISTAENGTASGLLIPGATVGGKTGTAQLGTDPPRSHAWIIGFAGPPDQEATVAVAVLVEGQEGQASENTGGTVAAPIAQAVMEAVLAQRAAG